MKPGSPQSLTIASPVFVSDFVTLRSLRVTEVHVMVRRLRVPGQKRVHFPINIHCAFLFVSEDHEVWIARGGPTQEPADELFLRTFLDELAYRSLRLTHAEVFSRHWGKKLNSLRTNFGYMLPVVHKLGDLASRGLDSDRFESIEQGRGIKGLRPDPSLQISDVFQGRSSQLGDHGHAVTPQSVFNDVLAYTEKLARHPPSYNLLPHRQAVGANCISYLGGAAANAHIYSLVRERAAFAVGLARLRESKKRRLRRSRVVNVFGSPLHEGHRPKALKPYCVMGAWPPQP